MPKRQSESDKYLQMYPELMKWINECIICHSKGYKPEMPEHISREFSVAGKNLRKFFNPLVVDDLSICEQCGNFARLSHK